MNEARRKATVTPGPAVAVVVDCNSDRLAARGVHDARLFRVRVFYTSHEDRGWRRRRRRSNLLVDAAKSEEDLKKQGFEQC
jgi:hypothetical protein